MQLDTEIVSIYVLMTSIQVCALQIYPGSKAEQGASSWWYSRIPIVRRECYLSSDVNSKDSSLQGVPTSFLHVLKLTETCDNFVALGRWSFLFKYLTLSYKAWTFRPPSPEAASVAQFAIPYPHPIKPPGRR
jgi:hypothetical protein